MSEQSNTHSFATVAGVFDDGVTLIFDGEEEPGQKHYLVNTSVAFAAGDRVKVSASSGTYMVEYVVGKPTQGPTGGPLGLPPGGTKGQVLVKNGNTDGDASWSDQVRANAMRNQYNSSTLASSTYDIYFRTKSSSTYGTPVFQIRFGPTGTWYTLTTTT